MMSSQRIRTSRTFICLFVAAGVLAGCSSASSVNIADGVPAEPITPPPTVSIVPTETPTPTTAVPQPTAAPETTLPAPETTVPVPAPETTVPVDPSATTTVDPSVSATDAVAVPPEAVPVDAAAPQTVPPEPTTTTIDPLAQYEVAPPPAELIRAIGSTDGDGTRAVQQRLLDLHFWNAGVDGDYGHTTRQAVMAFQKYYQLPATGKVDQETADKMNLVDYYPRALAFEGDLIEINKDMQVLFIVRGGKTLWLLNTSTATGQTYEEPDRNTPGEIQRGTSITPTGIWAVDRERPEGWWEGDLGKIYRPKYFRGGVAVHGSGSIPNYPASHGCVRVSTQAMDMIWFYDLMPIGTPVWVYGSDPPQVPSA